VWVVPGAGMQQQLLLFLTLPLLYQLLLHLLQMTRAPKHWTCPGFCNGPDLSNFGRRMRYVVTFFMIPWRS
jgi:hypothetical protein